VQIKKGSKRYLVAKVFIIFFIFFSCILLAYTFHRAEITFSGTRAYVYNKYYIFSVASLIFWIFILKLKDEIILNTVLFSLSILASLYLAEAILNKVLSPEYSDDYDTRTVYEVYTDLINNGYEAIPSVRPSIFLSSNGLPLKDKDELLPLSGVSNIKTVYCNESGKRIIYQSDKYGFRNTSSSWDKTSNLWVLIGDSFTQGACVEDEHTFASYIDNLEEEVSVISLGMGGNGPLIELASIEEYAKDLKPEKVFWLYFEGNDLANLPEELNSPILRKYLNREFNQNLKNRQEEIDSRINEFVKESKDQRESRSTFQLETFVQNSRTLRLLYIRRFLGIDQKGNDADFTSDFKKVIEEAKIRIKQWNGELIFVYLPEYSRYLLDEPGSLSFRQRGEVLSIIEGLEIEVIDIHEQVFDKHPDPLSLFPRRTEAHYTPEGYNLSSKVITEAKEK